MKPYCKVLQFAVSLTKTTVA